MTVNLLQMKHDPKSMDHTIFQVEYNLRSHKLVVLHFKRISSLVPVSGPVLPILIMAAAKFVKEVL